MHKATLLAAVIAIFSLSPLHAGDTSDAPATISISGTGEVAAAPDMARFSLSVSNEGSSAREALSANSENMRAVIERLKEAGVEDRLVQTGGLSVAPQWDRGHAENARQPRILGYIASNSINVTVEELDKLGRIIDAAVTDGANGLGGITFGLKDPKPTLNEARRLSVEDAKGQAELYADAAGVRLEKILSIIPAGGVRPVMQARTMAFDSMESVPIAEGEVNTRSDVTITWEIAPAD